MKMGIKNFKQVFKALKQAYGNKYAWTEVKDVLNSEGQSLNISEEDIHDPFKNLIIGILSQNTSDRNSTRAYVGLVKEFGKITPEVLSKASVEKIKSAIKPGGLYNLKSKRIKKLTQTIWERYDGDLTKITKLPKEKARKELLELPGIGQKTADVFITDCLGIGVMVVDTNIERVVKRLGFVSSGAEYCEIKNTLEKDISPKERLRAHELLIRLGRDYCKATKPLCNVCPLNKLCEKNLIKVID